MGSYAADIVELLDGELKISRAAVIGLSMGGLVAMEFAVWYPEQCWALGLVATTAEPVTPQERITRLERAEAVERDGMDVLVEYMHTGLCGLSCPQAGLVRWAGGAYRVTPQYGVGTPVGEPSPNGQRI